MSNSATSTSSQKRLGSSNPKVQSSLTINTSNPAESPNTEFPYTSRNHLQKENTYDYILQNSNSLHTSAFIKPVSQQSCRALRSSHQQPIPSNPFRIQSNSTRNLNISQINSIVTKSTDLSKKSPETIYKEHLFQTFQAVKFLRNLPQPEAAEINNKSIWLAKRKGYENKRTIIFDLDETLVHCIENAEQGDFSITIPMANGKTIRAGVNVRPFVQEVLASANKDFEVIVFTASHRCYADEVMNYLDPTGELIHHRLYRDNCLAKSGVFIKDLRVFANRRIEDIVIVDNSTYCFGYQLENGIPIISWFDDKNDRELFKLIKYIKILAQVPDITIVNRHTFHLNSFYTDYLRDYLKPQDRE